MDENPLQVLTVFDQLEVGPTVVEKQRLRTPYKLTVKGTSHEIELIYRYEEDVFDPGDPASINLASMIGAQVAINYGLFCQSIVFRGNYDEIDRRFIQNMTENTSREIFVKKFLEPNLFLSGPVSQLPALKYPKYTQAKIEFPDQVTSEKKAHWKLWNVDRQVHAILSSGGKDSLLSFGLIQELGYEIHPIYINESGRHWLTAYNAFHYFKKNISNTTRVWTNSDQLFNWFVRHMPFIRPDFQSIRFDEYPIRLWTVAVFLFGALPLVRKRGIGRVLIGDEYDTSTRVSTRGIPHYNGLFDQSRYFDNTLSRYYLQKGWSITQLSILRPLSELLIQKILTELFPDLQKHQISCHAAHKEEDRVKPCGKCEKCRRIVSMLMAIDADPGNCGYTEEQIKRCLKEFQEKGAAQESAGVKQLYWMLLKKGLLPEPADKSKMPIEQSEILKVRFDPERSPVHGLPMDLRMPLIRLYMEHANGAVQRVGRIWKEIDPLSDLEITRPYPFELGGIQLKESRKGDDDITRRYIWGELTWVEAQKQLQEVDIALLPVGSIEQHGPHLPLDTDAYDAEYLAHQVAQACSHPKPLVLPGISYGVSYEHNQFSGTMSISNDTLTRLVYEIGMSAYRNSIKKLVIINGHGGNTPALNHAAQMINRDAKIFVCVDSGETSDVDIYSLIQTPNDVHAGEIETSTSLAVRPQLVRMNLAKKSIPEFSSRYLNFTSKRKVSWYAYTKNVSESGVLGDPTQASAEKGKKIWQIMTAHLVSLVEDLKNMTLDEIHNRKY
jgi:creatinine amidohydrolase/Fe(II)-dependent formamide hydrolase-like protein